HPLDDLAIESFLNGDVRHGGRRRRTVPMLQAGWKPHHIAGTNFFDWSAFTLRVTATARDDERLTKRMCVPRGACARLERDARAGSARRCVGLEQRIYSHCAAEPIRRTFGRSL